MTWFSDFPQDWTQLYYKETKGKGTASKKSSQQPDFPGN